ncbi:MAG: T9SS type A sorting domain-containing protein, partial [Candidatus Cloacimonadaceae bacterium]|nr:T9SS type A sorting domain-containing protein [Candidatus Cloacimonadaceae bacterium]
EGNPHTYNHNVGEITWQGINEPGSSGEAGYRYLDFTDCVLHDLSIGSNYSQYRIAFQINTDYDYGPDFVAFLSANSNPDYPEFLPIMFFTLYNPTSVSDDLSPVVILAVTSSPNPFSSRVTFDISLKIQTDVSIKLYDLRGRVAKELGTTPYSKGTHDISMKTDDLPNGIYLLQVKAGSDIITKKITCLK